MATFVNPVIATAPLEEGSIHTGRVGFLTSRPVIGEEYAEYRPPGSLWAYLRANDGYVELYVVDNTGNKFLGIR